LPRIRRSNAKELAMTDDNLMSIINDILYSIAEHVSEEDKEGLYEEIYETLTEHDVDLGYFMGIDTVFDDLVVEKEDDDEEEEDEEEDEEFDIDAED
jgi:hypothetical protein